MPFLLSILMGMSFRFHTDFVVILADRHRCSLAVKDAFVTLSGLVGYMENHPNSEVVCTGLINENDCH